MVIFVILVILSYFDIRQRRIPVFIVSLGFSYWIMEQVYLFFVEKKWDSYIIYNLITVFIVVGICLMLRAICRDCIGMGDIFLLGLFSLLTEYLYVATSLIVTFSLFFLFSFFLLIFGYSKKTALPFAPFLLVGYSFTFIASVIFL